MISMVWSLGLAGAPPMPPAQPLLTRPLPTLNIEPGGVAVAGCSHAADFAHQFHVSFSSLVSGACIFSGQPFHCAVTRFPQDALVDQSPASSVPRCNGCPGGKTLIYDHCKNHPEWVDVGALPDYPRRACGQNPITKTRCIDPPEHLFNARVYLFRGTHDRCYLKGAVANVHALYSQLVSDPARQLRFVDDLPFPHTLPTNSTPYFNSSTPAGFDGPGECLRWVFDNGTMLAGPSKASNVLQFDQRPFMDAGDAGTGIADSGYIYIPTGCRAGRACKLMVLPSGFTDPMQPMQQDWLRYAEQNGIVVLQPCVGGPVNASRFPGSTEVQRGLLDVYGQLSDDYAMQSGFHMKVFGRIMRHVMGDVVEDGSSVEHVGTSGRTRADGGS